MPESKELILEGPTLEACRKEAAEKLGIPAEQIRLKVLQAGKKGIFSSTPFRVRAMDRNAAPSAKGDTAVFQNKMQSRIQVVMEELGQLDLLGKEDEIFDSVLASYEDLPEDRRMEIKEVAELLSSTTGAKVRGRISRDATFHIRVADDKLACYLDLTAPEGMGEPVTLHAVLGHMRKIGLTHGVNHVRIRELLELVIDKAQPIKDALVAEGTAPQSGIDGSIEYSVVPGKKEEILQEDDSMDYRGKASIAVVGKDEKLARMVLPTDGTPGMNVYGESIPAKPGKCVHLEPGANVYVNQVTSEFFSAIDGVMELTENIIKVHPTFIVREDVDMTTGNIEFSGDVRIGGSVRDGFIVRATGNIEIRGGVEGCEIVSETGNVAIAKGVAGRHRCFISASNDVKVGYIETARVYAGNTVEVAGSILHSEVVAGNAVLAMRGKGSIMGGVTKAGHLVHMKRLGAPSETPTEVVVGINMEEHEQIRQMDQRLVSLKNTANQLEEIVKEAEHGKQGASKSSRKEKENLASLKMKLIVLHHTIDQTLSEREGFLKEVTAEAKGTVKASTEVFGNVTIRIGSLVEHVKIHLSMLAFEANMEEGRIVQKPYKS